MKKELSEQEQALISNLKEAIIAEKTAEYFYRCICHSLKNCRIRNRIKEMAEDEEKPNHKILQERFKKIVEDTDNLKSLRPDVENKPCQFSSEVLLKMAKDSEGEAIKFYNRAKRQDATKYRKVYDSIIIDEKKHWRYLKKELRALEEDIQYTNPLVLKLFALLKDGIK